MTPTQEVPQPTAGTLLEAKMCQSMKAMLSEALGPLTSNFTNLAKEVHWLRHNAITAAELEERLEMQEMEEDRADDGAAAGQGASSDAELIDATARSRREKAPPLRLPARRPGGVRKK